MENKICVKCKQTKSLIEFWKDASTKDKLKRWCKFCLNELKSKYVEKNSSKIKESSKNYRERNRSQLLQQRKNHYNSKKDELNAISREYYRKNKEILKVNRKAYYQKTREQRLAYSKKFKQENVGLYTTYSVNRRCLKRKAIPPWADLGEIRKFYLESRRLSLETGVQHSVDHIVPLQGKTVCGLHVQTNLRVIPLSENLSKTNFLVEELL